MNILGIPGIFQLILIIFVITVVLLPLIALIDILRNEFNGSDKLVWVLVVLFIPFLGSILYFAIGSQRKMK